MILIILSAATLVAALCALGGYRVPVLLSGLLLASLLLTLLAGVLWMPSGVFARPLLGGPPHRRVVALTFDDGPDPLTTPKVLEALRRSGTRATFFVVGARAEKNPDLLARMAEEGHQIENHSFHHSYLTAFRSPAALADELRRAGQSIRAATGRPPRWFRPPVGLLSPRVAEAARRAGLGLCGFTVKARDGVRGTTCEMALARLLRGLRPGAILLMHDAAERGDREPIAAEVLSRLLPALLERGYTCATLDELVGGAPGDGHRGGPEPSAAWTGPTPPR